MFPIGWILPLQMQQPFSKGYPAGPPFNSPGPMSGFQAGHPLSVGQTSFDKSDEQMKNDLVSPLGQNSTQGIKDLALFHPVSFGWIKMGLIDLWDVSSDTSCRVIWLGEVSCQGTNWRSIIFMSPGFRLGLPRKYLAVVFCKLLKEAGLNSSSVSAT